MNSRGNDDECPAPWRNGDLDPDQRLPRLHFFLSEPPEVVVFSESPLFFLASQGLLKVFFLFLLGKRAQFVTIWLENLLCVLFSRVSGPLAAWKRSLERRLHGAFSEAFEEQASDPIHTGMLSFFKHSMTYFLDTLCVLSRDRSVTSRPKWDGGFGAEKYSVYILICIHGDTVGDERQRGGFDWRPKKKKKHRGEKKPFSGDGRSR